MTTLKNSMINRLLVLGVLVFGLTTIAKAEPVNIDGLYYELNEDESTASVTYQTTTSSNYSSLSAELIIPSSVSYNGRNYTVTSIADKAFYYCKKIESIKIPSSVIQIGSTTTTSSNRPFYNCTALKSLWFEDGDEPIYFGSVYSTSTGTSMFSGCPIEEIYLGRPINVSNYNDSYPYSSYVSRYGYSPFYNLTKLQKIVIGKNISSLDKYLFYKCTGLTTLDFSSSNIKKIEEHCFNGCTGLTQFENPSSLLEIGESAFYGCRGLVNLKLTNIVISGSSFYQCTGLKNLEIDCETIPEKCFYGCTNLSNIQFGKNVKFIENLNFNNCTSLTEIEIPANIERIGRTMTTTANRPFYGCTTLKNVTIQDDNKKLILGTYYASGTGASIFSGCPIESVYIGRNIIYDDYNEEYPSISYPQRYGYSAFYNQSKLTNATIGSNINSLDQYLFYNCANLKQVNFIDDNCKEIEKYCFNGCSSLATFTSPSNLEKIGNYAFYGCSALSQFSFSDKLLTIGDYSFYNCNNLTNIDFPDSLLTIGDNGFYGCIKLTEFRSPSTLQSLG